MWIRRARLEEAASLTELALRSKGHWPYDAEFLKDVRPELTFEPRAFLPDFHVYVREGPDGIVGFASLIPKEAGRILLNDLFIEPAHIGHGHGRALWDFSVNLARELRYTTLVLVADPYAEAFYSRRGAVKVGEQPSPVRPGRRVPVMEYSLGA